MKNIVIIGASGGIGISITEKLLQRYDDCQLTLISRKKPSISDDRAKWVEADVLSSLPDIGVDAIDGLVYCPGTIDLKPFQRLKPDDFRQEFEINVVGAVNAIQHFLKPLRKAPKSSIVLYSTVATYAGMPFHSGIAAAKGAVEGLTKSLAAEFAQKNIRVNAVAPSLTDTPLAEHLLGDEKKREAGAKRHPLGRYGQPADIANATLFLLGDDSDWISGQILHVDGGLSTLKV